MFANNEITGRGRLHKLLDEASREVTMDDRETWARAIDSAIKHAASASMPSRSHVARPVVVLGAASALSGVADLLRDEDVAVSPDALEAVRAFMTNGIDSPLYGSDPLAAGRDADALRRRLAAAGARPRAASGAVA